MHQPARPPLVSRLHRLLVAAVLVALVIPVLPGDPESRSSADAAGPTGASLGYDRIGVRRGSSWLLHDSLAGGVTTSYADGEAGWLPVAGDTDRDGSDSVSLFRDGVWKLRDARDGKIRTIGLGRRGDQPVLGDWNGDGLDTMGVFRAGRWYISDRNGDGTVRSFSFGRGGDRAVVGDWDGNGRTDIGVLRGNRFLLRDAARSGQASRSFEYGTSGDLPVAGDWDHDGRDTVGVFRKGLWMFRDAAGRTQAANLGRSGDRPVVRRTPGLAPGTTHRIVRRDGAVAHVVSVTLSAASTPDAVLAGNRLPGLERTSSIARRTRARVAINGDFALSSGRPVHAFAADGQLQQTAPPAGGRGLGLHADGRNGRAGSPTVRVVLTPSGQRAVQVGAWNGGGPPRDGLAGYTAASSGLETIPPDSCYAGLRPRDGSQVVTGRGAVEQQLEVTGVRCGGSAPRLPASDTALVSAPRGPGSVVIKGLRKGLPVVLSQSLGFPGAADLIGASEGLVTGGRVQQMDPDGGGYVHGRHPRSAVGITAEGRLLMVVVDGRQRGYSNGMSLPQLAVLMRDLGARDAINLDGGGSSTMWVNGLLVNRPSDGRERAVSSALVVLPGPDPGQGRLRTGQPAPPAEPPPLVPGLPFATAADPAPLPPDWLRAAQDPASTGGLAAALAEQGVALPPSLELASDVFRASGG